MTQIGTADPMAVEQQHFSWPVQPSLFRHGMGATEHIPLVHVPLPLQIVWSMTFGYSHTPFGHWAGNPWQGGGSSHVMAQPVEPEELVALAETVLLLVVLLLVALVAVALLTPVVLVAPLLDAVVLAALLLAVVLLAVLPLVVALVALALLLPEVALLRPPPVVSDVLPAPP